MSLLKEFLETCQAAGVGNLPKKELDLWIFRVLVEKNRLEFKSDFEIANALHMTPAKVRTWRYEIALRSGENPTEHIARALPFLLKAAILRGDKQVAVNVENRYTQEAIQAWLKSKQLFADHSFNKELLVLSKGAFQALVMEFSPLEKQIQLDPSFWEKFWTQAGDALLKQGIGEGLKSGIQLLKWAAGAGLALWI